MQETMGRKKRGIGKEEKNCVPSKGI